MTGPHAGRLAGARQYRTWHHYLHGRLDTYTTAAPDLAPAAAAVRRQLDTTDLDIEPRLLHHDLQPGHLVRPAAGGSLLDWELAAFGDPLSDLARLAVRLDLTDPTRVLQVAHQPTERRPQVPDVLAHSSVRRRSPQHRSSRTAPRPGSPGESYNHSFPREPRPLAGPRCSPLTERRLCVSNSLEDRGQELGFSRPIPGASARGRWRGRCRNSRGWRQRVEAAKRSKEARPFDSAESAEEGKPLLFRPRLSVVSVRVCAMRAEMRGGVSVPA
ncbi:phosphotransferase family protein [Streptomyces zhihengii]